MRKRPTKIPVNVELEMDVNTPLEQWAEREGRSKRRHLAILARQLVELKESNPDALEALGLLSRAAVKR